MYPAAPQRAQTAHAQARAVEPAGITSSAHQRQSWAIRGPLALCPTALAGPVKGSSSSPVRCSGCRPQQRACSSPITPPARSRAAAQQQAPIRNRPIAVTSDQSRPSILSGPYQAPFHLFFFQSFHLSIPATPPPPHRITFLSELPCSICWKPAACTPSRLQPIESESFS